MAGRESRFDAGMVLFLHNRYRTTGGEERAVERPAVARARAPAASPRSCSRATLRASGARARRSGCCAEGSSRARWPARCARAVRASCTPTTCSRRSAGARWRPRESAGARVVLHLHQYRLVCAIGVCFTRGAECTRCHGRDTLPGVRLNCRGSLPEAFAYGASLALWQRRLVEQADAVIVPSAFARERLRELGAPLPWERVHVLAPPLRALDGETSGGGGSATAQRATPPATAADPATASPAGPTRCVVARLSPEKGVDVAIDACRIAGMPLVVAGDGPERASAARARRARGRSASSAASTTASWRGCAPARRSRSRPSRSGETFGLAAAEAMAAGLPVAASRVGALPELVDGAALVPPGRRRARWPPRSRAWPAIGRPASGAASGCARCARRRWWRRRWRACMTGAGGRGEAVSCARANRP